MSPRKPKEDTAELSIIGRASQKAVDFSLIWRNCGLPGVVFIAACFAAYWIIPWWGEHISEPESKARIADAERSSLTMGKFAEAIKATAENEKARLEEVGRHNALLETFVAQQREMINEWKALRSELKDRK